MFYLINNKYIDIVKKQNKLSINNVHVLYELLRIAETCK